MVADKPQLKRTYGSRPTRTQLSSSHPSNPSSLPPVQDASSILTKRKRPLMEHLGGNIDRPLKKPALKKSTGRGKNLTQLHFSLDKTILRACPLCQLSYTKGAFDDERLHKAHCMRVQKGLEWGREEEKEKVKAGVNEIAEGVKLGSGEKGRIVAVKSDTGGKIGQKVSAFLESINLALSAPPLTPAALHMSKAYLFLVPTGSQSREKIVGCVIAQRITTAMEIVAQESHNSATQLVYVDSNLYCKAHPLPTPLGIPRLFVSSSYRHKGIAQHLLTAAAKTFIHGWELDPKKGEVAFSQPTSLGRLVMKKWGGDSIRIFEE